MRLTKSQKQLIMLGTVLAATVVVLGVFVFKPEGFVQTPYQAKDVDTAIPRDVVEHPEYGRLRLPVELPIVPGRMGRENPFEPY